MAVSLITALNRAIIYRTVVFVALQHAHLSSMADEGAKGSVDVFKNPLPNLPAVPSVGWKNQEDGA